MRMHSSILVLTSVIGFCLIGSSSVNAYDPYQKNFNKTSKLTSERDINEADQYSPDEGNEKNGAADENNVDEGHSSKINKSSQEDEPEQRGIERKSKKDSNESSLEEDLDGDKKKHGSKINEFIDFGGTIEVQAFYHDDFRRQHSDIVLEGAEIEFEITLVDWARGYLCYEWEPDIERLLVKEAYITLGGTDCYPWFVRAGRLFVPFTIGTGALVGDTLSVTDPLTIEIFETREDVVMAGKIWDGYMACVYVFNGDARHVFDEEHHNDHIDQFGASFRYAFNKPWLEYSYGIDFISNVFESDNLSERFFEIAENRIEDRYAPGISIHGRILRNRLSFIAEFDTALKKGHLDLNGEHLHLMPMAWMFEIGYEFAIWCKKSYVAFDYSQSHDLQGLFPEYRFLLTWGTWLYEDILLAFEYGYDIDYSTKHAGTGRSSHRVTGQLAYEF